MADTAAENEADSGTSSGPQTTTTPDGTTTTTTTTPQGGGAGSADDDGEQNDNERVTGSNYESTEAIYRCNHCEFESISQLTLTTHIQQAHNSTNEVEMELDNNNQTTTTTTQQQQQLQSQTNQQQQQDRVHRKMFECDVCNMKFSNGANMRRHKMRHTGVKPYECRVCQKRFFRKDHLAEHFTTHTKTLPYHCPICNRGFQRQIAMRAHFQNEHVGQHDLVKSCPLCSYRAGSMKSLRVHFFNRHGIDLDNPGPAGSSASLFAAAAQQGFTMDGAALSSLSNLTSSVSVSVTGGGGGGGGGGANYSDSGDSNGARSTDNATPPMHFLTPHVEISMADAPAPVFSPTLSDQQRMNQPGQSGDSSQRMLINGECPGSPQSADSNSNAPSSSHHIQSNSLRIDQETNITPSISLIPIKQEPGDDLYDNITLTTTTVKQRNGPVNLSTSPSSGNNNNNNNNNVQMQTATSSSLSSLIKVSPLKSLLRDDLKRKIVSRMNSTQQLRNSNRQTNNISPPSNHNNNQNQNPESSPLNDTQTATTTNGTITSTGSEQPSDSTLWRNLNKRTINSLQCIFCGIGFPDQTLYFLHKGCHSDANPWKCNICGEQCCNVYEFNSHLLSKSHQ